MAFQSYHGGWRAVVVDDDSDQDCRRSLAEAIDSLELSARVEVLWNKKREWEVANVLKALELVKADEIVCRLDLDDYLCDLNALEMLAAAYSEIPDLDAAWTAHRWVSEGKATSRNISQAMPADADPYVHSWCASHLKTWRKSVSDRISDANYRGADGQYFKRIGDQAFYLPVLKLARKRVFVPVATYAYSCDVVPSTFESEDAAFQKAEADYLRRRGFLT